MTATKRMGGFSRRSSASTAPAYHSVIAAAISSPLGLTTEHIETAVGVRAQRTQPGGIDLSTTLRGPWR